MNEENAEKTAEKVPGIPFKEGDDPRRNLEGRPKGSLNFNTIFEAAIRKIVEEKKINIDDPEREMVVKAVIEALKGNLGYFKDLMDRKYGKAVQPLEHLGKLTIEQVLKDIENENAIIRQTMENK